MQTGKKPKSPTPPGGSTPRKTSTSSLKKNKRTKTGVATPTTNTTPSPTTGSPAAPSPVAVRVNAIKTMGLGAGIGRMLDGELQHNATLTDPLASATADVATATKVVEFGDIVFDAEFLAAVDPSRRAALDNEILQANASDTDRRNLATRLAAEVATTKSATTAALFTVQNAQPNQLATMTPDARIDLIRDLVHGDPTRHADRRAALITVYWSTRLDPAFTTAEVQRITAALAAVKNIGGLAAKRNAWATLSDADKKALLEDVLKTHGTALGILGSEIPALKLYSEDPKLTPTAEGAHNNGFYDSNTNTIYLNDRKDAFKAHFDDILDTLVHENTHNRQRLLVEQLSAPNPPAPGTVEHQQATLFALNSTTNGYVEPPSNVYKLQPTEEHAWLAGGIAGRLFLDEARAAARTLQAEIMTFSLGKQPPLSTTLEGLAVRLQPLLAGDVTAGHVTREVNNVRLLLNDRKAELAPPTGPAADLIARLDTFLGRQGLSAEERTTAEQLKTRAMRISTLPRTKQRQEAELVGIDVSALEEN